MKNIPYTKNTREARDFLRLRGFKPLSFYQGDRFIYPMISTWANKTGEWKEKNYATFSSPDEMHILMGSESSLDEFINHIDELFNQ